MNQMNVVNIPEWMRGDYTIEEMYSRAVAEAERKLAGNTLIAQSSKESLAYYRQSWCTEGLFDYLLIGGERALAELRAAAYPLPIGFTLQESGFWQKVGFFKKEWQAFYTPYIFTLPNRIGYGGKEDYRLIKRKPMPKFKRSYDYLDYFYMNCNRDILSMHYSADVLQAYDEGKFKNKAAYEEKIKSEWKKLSKKNKIDINNCKQCRFLDIKTNKEQWAFIKTGAEDFDNKNRNAGQIKTGCSGNVTWEVLNADGTWRQTYDITRLHNDPNMSFEDYINSIYTPEQQKRIKYNGRVAIIKLNEILFGTNNLKKWTIKCLTDPKTGKQIKLKHSEFFDRYEPAEIKY